MEHGLVFSITGDGPGSERIGKEPGIVPTEVNARDPSPLTNTGVPENTPPAVAVTQDAPLASTNVINDVIDDKLSGSLPVPPDI